LLQQRCGYNKTMVTTTLQLSKAMVTIKLLRIQ